MARTATADQVSGSNVFRFMRRLQKDEDKETCYSLYGQKGKRSEPRVPPLWHSHGWRNKLAKYYENGQWIVADAHQINNGAPTSARMAAADCRMTAIYIYIYVRLACFTTVMYEPLLRSAEEHNI